MNTGDMREPFVKHAGEIVVMNLKPYASTLLTVCGIILMGMGLYFALIRPALLLEDIRYIGLSSEQLQATAPNLLNWLDKVFWVMGGYTFASGLLIGYVAQTAFRERRRGVLSVVSLAGLTSRFDGNDKLSDRFGFQMATIRHRCHMVKYCRVFPVVGTIVVLVRISFWMFLEA